MSNERDLSELERALRADPKNQSLRRRYERTLFRSELTPDSKILLRSGRAIRLINVIQDSVHEGVKDELPNAQINQQQFDRLRSSPPDIFTGRSTILLEPHYRDVSTLDQSIPWYYEDQEPQILPAISCLGIFKSDEPAENPEMDFSQLRILWYQENYLFPIDVAVMKQILDIDWNSHAFDGRY